MAKVLPTLVTELNQAAANNSANSGSLQSDGTKEFTEDAIAKLEDDELFNEEDAPIEENLQTPKWGDPNEEKAVNMVRVDDVNMMDDVKQMAAALGNEILSFENQLRPIDLYGSASEDLYSLFLIISNWDFSFNLGSKPLGIRVIRKWKCCSSLSYKSAKMDKAKVPLMQITAEINKLAK
ncbi:hypothetical protein L1987_06338 [Smallanthus sonchifolius]|uniref:Uncharacterized protein n=1 Tax=Smallanthus sonchifolius TaxID=185202 RepID=A0ACB9JXU1_9ASTR|nr:hypothetical protein L1987_06338 [Smallanthus sonchifolius]